MRVREAIDSVGGLVTNLVAALRGASALTLLIAVLVLGGALAAGHRHRVYDAVVLKTVGATRGKLLAAYALEYLMLGVATAVFGVAAGTAAAAFVIRQVMNLPFTWLPGPDLAAAAGAVVGDRGARPDRHLPRARPEAGAGAAEPVKQANSAAVTAVTVRALPAAMPDCAGRHRTDLRKCN